MSYLADCSLSLINRTGAHYIVSDVTSKLPQHFSALRYWRVFGRLPPPLARKILARLMFLEMDLLGTSPFLRMAARKGEPTLFFDPLYVTRAKLCADDIVLCHDVGPLTHRECFTPSATRSYERAYNKIKAAAPGVVFVSDASRRAFVSLFGSDFRFFEVLPPLMRSGLHQTAAAPVPEVKGPFLLTVGAFERRKNLPRSINAFIQSGLAERGFQYVVCGARGLDWQDVYAAAQGSNKVVILNYVASEQLVWLYQNASAFVLASLLEGFGMPSLEAASFGLLPVISSDSALEEATGGFGISVDPHSLDSIAGGMVEAVSLAPEESRWRSEQLKAFASRATSERFLAKWDWLLTNNGPC